jgi:ppGpp synthetase/RelA/SpoT-type nucleotidyltranferase
VTPPPNKSQMKRLGKRLADGHAEASDLEMLQAVLEHHTAVAVAAETRVRDALRQAQPSLEARVVSRGKTTATLVQKLRRETGMQLSTMQDIAGVRVVADMDIAEQDDVVRLIAGLFELTRPNPVDRRSAPSHGYRAVHVYALLDGANVEIQVRTWLQSRWAEIFEGVADVWGRQIRYGRAPDAETAAQAAQRQDFLARLAATSSTIKQWEELRVEVLRGRRDKLVRDLKKKSKTRTQASLARMTELRLFLAEQDRGHAEMEQAADAGQARLRAELADLAAATTSMSDLSRSRP